MLVSPLLLLIGSTGLLGLLLLFQNGYVITFILLKFNASFKRLLLWVIFLNIIHFEVFLFRNLFFIFAFFIDDLFICINWMSVN